MPSRIVCCINNSLDPVIWDLAQFCFHKQQCKSSSNPEHLTVKVNETTHGVVECTVDALHNFIDFVFEIVSEGIPCSMSSTQERDNRRECIWLLSHRAMFVFLQSLLHMKKSSMRSTSCLLYQVHIGLLRQN